MSVPGRDFQSSLMFAGKASNLLENALGWVPGLNSKHQTKLEKPPGDKPNKPVPVPGRYLQSS